MRRICYLLSDRKECIFLIKIKIIKKELRFFPAFVFFLTNRFIVVEESFLKRSGLFSERLRGLHVQT